MSKSENPAGMPDTLFLHRLQITSLSLLTFVLTVYVLREFETVLKPLFVAVFIAYAIAPLYRQLVRYRFPPLGAYILIALSILGLLAVVGMMVYSNVRDFDEDRLIQYRDQLLNLASRLDTQIPYVDLQPAFEFVVSESQNPRRWLSVIESALGSFIGFLGVAVVVVFYLLFILIEQHAFSRRIQSAFSNERSSEILHIITQINVSISSYISVKALMSLLTGMATTIVLMLFGVEFAIFWGVLTFLANFIPYVGSFVAVLMPVTQSVAQFPSQLWIPVVILILLTAIQQSIGVIIEPMVAGKRLNVSPLLIILSLAFWGFVWGVVGMVLAVPILMVIKTTLEHIPATASAGRLLSKV